jgi:hypothetical protein
MWVLLLFLLAWAWKNGAFAYPYQSQSSRDICLAIVLWREASPRIFFSLALAKASFLWKRFCHLAWHPALGPTLVPAVVAPCQFSHVPSLWWHERFQVQDMYGVRSCNWRRPRWGDNILGRKDSKWNRPFYSMWSSHLLTSVLRGGLTGERACNRQFGCSASKAAEWNQRSIVIKVGEECSFDHVNPHPMRGTSLSSRSFSNRSLCGSASLQ